MKIIAEDADEPCLKEVLPGFYTALGPGIYHRPPARLFHYTSQAGLVGIIEEGAIWATNHRHLNDSKEFSYGYGLALRLLQELAITEVAYGWYLQELGARVARVGEAPYRYYVACFSEERDLESQWNKYAAGDGFALGFEGDRLGPITRPFHFTKVTYDVSAQRSLLAGPMVAALGALRSCVERGKALSMRGRFVEVVGALTYQHLVHRMATVKAPDWGAEKEWRALFQEEGEAHRLVRHRSGGMPFMTFDIRDDTRHNGRLPLAELVVGPSCQVAVERSVREYLSARGYGHVPIVRSQA